MVAPSLQQVRILSPRVAGTSPPLKNKSRRGKRERRLTCAEANICSVGGAEAAKCVFRRSDVPSPFSSPPSLAHIF
jgi:hypothetical protein